MKLEQPVLLQALTFHRYWRPELKFAVNDVLPVSVSTTRIFVPISLTPTPYVAAPVDEFQRSVTLLLLCVGPGLPVVPGVGFVGVAGAAPAEPMPAPAKRSTAEIMTGSFTNVAPCRFRDRSV